MTEETDSVDQEDESTSVTVDSVTDSGSQRGSEAPDGWRQIATDPDRFVGHYEADGRWMSGGAEKTADGRYRFYVKLPPEVFWENAHQLLVPGRGLVDGAYVVDLPGEELPATLDEGLERVERLMVLDVDRDVTEQADSDQKEEDEA